MWTRFRHLRGVATFSAYAYARAGADAKPVRGNRGGGGAGDREFCTPREMFQEAATPQEAGDAQERWAAEWLQAHQHLLPDENDL
jgi:hypothetical protein